MRDVVIRAHLRSFHRFTNFEKENGLPQTVCGLVWQ